MGYIYPQRIRRILHGDKSGVLKFGYVGSGSLLREVGDQWTDGNGDTWEQKEGYVSKVTVLDEARVPLFCPECKHVMTKHQDTKFWLSRGKCMDCVIEEDNKLRLSGNYDKARKENEIRGYISYLNDTLKEVQDYFNTLNKNIKIVGEAGEVEKWSGEDLETTRKFLKESMKDIKKEIRTAKKNLKAHLEKIK